MIKKVKVYSTPFCPYCVTLKNFLKKNDIEFEEVDVSEDKKAAREMMEKSGQAGVPVAEIGDDIVVGFNRDKIKDLLDLED